MYVGNRRNKNEINQNIFTQGLEKSTPDLSGFGLSLFAELSKSEDSLLLSPYSVASSLSLVFAGTTPGSNSQTELSDSLNIRSHEDIGYLQDNIKSSNRKIIDGIDLTMANSVWTKNVKDDYIKLAEDMGAIANDIPKNYAPVDKWITDQTEGLLKDVVTGDIDPLTLALLVSAIHFKGTWTQKFDPNKSEDGIFYSNNGQKKAKFMKSKRNIDAAFSMRNLGGASAVRLDYGSIANAKEDQAIPDSDFCALLILPEKNTTESMQDAIQNLYSYTIKKTLEDLSPLRINLQLPRFRLEWGTESLKSSLESIGVKSVFNGQNQFSIMSDDPDVRLDDVLHKVVMEVSEEGTTAAAATIAVVGRMSMPRPPAVMRFDRPFLMMVIHVPTSTPLFLGKIGDPVFDF